MKTFLITITLIGLLTVSASAQNYSVDWYVIASGGGEMASANYGVNGTIGQPFTGSSSSANYTIESGFWVGAGGAGPACDYTIGDVNGSDSYNGLDITYGVAFFKGGNLPLCDPCALCPDFHYCGDVNSSCSYNGLDITYGVSFFKGGAGPIPCADCPPGGVILTSLPEKIVKSVGVNQIKQKGFTTGNK